MDTRQTVALDQAIFTSVRTPMGEGYRIIAVSRGLTADDRRAITRTSPSHDALCDPSPEAVGMACYPLPSGKLCIAHTCSAGVEHTGRGTRIYTHNLVAAPEGFAQFGFNPFRILRAAQAAGLLAPQLKPKPTLDPVELSTTGGSGATGGLPASDRHGVASDPRVGRIYQASCPWHPVPDDCAWMCYVLEGLLKNRRLVVRAGTVESAPPTVGAMGHPSMGHPSVAGTAGTAGTVDWAEMLWLGLPGPMRLNLGVCAGLRFSVARCRHLNVVTGAEDVNVSRVPDGQVEYVSASNWDRKLPPPHNPWVELVIWHWQEGSIAELDDRTSQPFTDTTPAALERVVRMYLALDEAPSADIPQLLALVTEYADHRLESKVGTVEANIADRLVSVVGNRLLTLLRSTNIDDVESHRPSITDVLQRLADWKKNAPSDALPGLQRPQSVYDKWQRQPPTPNRCQ